MTKVRVYLLPENLVRRAFVDENLSELVTEYFGEFIPTHIFQVKGEGEDAAEETFDLTNNPSRYQERLDVYGRNRNVCMGDVVEVFDTKGNSAFYLCKSIGWDCISIKWDAINL